MERIKQLLKSSKLFEQASEEIITKLTLNATRLHFKEQEIIVHEGDMGNDLYLVESGVVKIFCYKFSGEEIIIARLESGHYFGEQAILYDTSSQHHASAEAVTDVSIIKISRDILSSLFPEKNKFEKISKKLRKEIVHKLTKQLTVLGDLKDEILSLESKYFQEFQDKDIIYKQGDPPDFMYLILAGEVEISANIENQLLSQQLLVRAGHIFGEMDLLDNKLRTSSAKAIGHVKVLIISKELFDQFYSKNPAVGVFACSVKRMYSIPGTGMLTQCHDSISGKEAICSNFKLQNGATILAISALDGEIFTIKHTDAKDIRKLHYRENAVWREIYISNNKLVGMANVGLKKNVAAITRMILDKVQINKLQEEHFEKTGIPLIPTKPKHQGNEQDIVCECLLVTLGTIKNAIRSGAITIQEIHDATGAGTVCGSCREAILNLLGKSNWLPASIQLIQEHNDDVRTYLIKPIKKNFIPSLPGQFIYLQVLINQTWVERAYTLTSLPNESFYKITVKKEQDGFFSEWLFNQQYDVHLSRISLPQGNFILNFDVEKPAVCFAGGIGITPFFVFATSLCIAKSQRRLHIVYSVHSERDLIFMNELQNLVADNTNISLSCHLSGNKGRIKDEEVSDIINQFSGPEIFICGPKGFEQIIATGAKKSGITKKLIRVERFYRAADKD